MSNAPLILGIESSCDETAAAVVRAGEQILSSVVLSQFATHQPYGGVVPELASREHLRSIVPVVRKALADAHQTYDSVDAIAVTQGPGLAGALMVGVSFAKALAFANSKPLIAVNHLEGHIHAVLLEQKQKAAYALRFPLLALVVSGGHTHLYLAKVAANDEPGTGGWSYENIGHTRDDAAGEAFDKVAKLLGLGYPGGPLIDQLAAHGDPSAVKFTIAQMKMKGNRRRKSTTEHLERNADAALLLGSTGSSDRTCHGGAKCNATSAANNDENSDAMVSFDFSYSGIKTAVLRHVENAGMHPSIAARSAAIAGIAKLTAADVLPYCDQPTLDLIASFQHNMVTDLVRKTLAAAEACNAAMLFVTGGVAANSALRLKFEHDAAEIDLPVFFPSRPLSTDNAAMIAAAAYPKFISGEFAGMDLSVDPSLRLR